VSSQGIVYGTRHALSHRRDKKDYTVVSMRPGPELGYRAYQVERQVHRLVAEAFIPNPNNLPMVLHIDGNRRDDSAKNLAWVSQQDYKLGQVPVAATQMVQTPAPPLTDDELDAILDDELG